MVDLSKVEFSELRAEITRRIASRRVSLRRALLLSDAERDFRALEMLDRTLTSVEAPERRGGLADHFESLSGVAS